MLQRVDKREKVALTFDDGPDNHSPPPLILDILSENNIPATFFVVGQQINYVPEIVKNS
ncbi:polysaccharide deacetylase family protein [Bacillus cereus]|nr:polysaccharide deacetylase family protein [Bacillus cereus]